MAKIQLDHVSYSYPNHGRPAEVLHDLNLTIERGEFVCVVGRSGCGKTTLLRLLAGLDFPTQGIVRIDGEPVDGPGTDRSIVFQSYTLFPWMTARQNILFGIQQTGKWGRADARRLADAFLQKVELTDAADKYPYQLSGGMRQRVAIARSLAMDTEILLLDEPFGALDAKIRGELQEFMDTLRWGGGQSEKTVVFVTHDIDEALYLADRIIYMTPGRIASDIPVLLPRPRNRLLPEEREQMEALRRELLGLFDREEGAPCWRAAGVS